MDTGLQAYPPFRLWPKSLDSHMRGGNQECVFLPGRTQTCVTDRSIRKGLLDGKWTKIPEGEIQMDNQLKNLKPMRT